MPEARKPTEIMADIAAQNGCTSEPYSQIAVLKNVLIPGMKGGDGICHGLSVAWLEAIKNGRDGGFLHEASQNWSTGQAFARSYHIWNMQFQEEQWQKLVGLTPALDQDNLEKEKEFQIDQQSMLLFAHWLRAGIGTRYFLISVKGHAMAAAGSSTGKLKFFDPNAGVVTTKSASNLANFLSAFLNNELMRSHYFPYKNGRRIGVKKLKKG